MKRAHAIALVAAVAASPARSARAQDTPLRVGVGPVESYAEGWYAVEMGFFKQAGLDVTPTSVPGGGGPLTMAVVSGALDISISNTAAMAAAHARGLPLVLLFPGAVYSSNSPVSVLAVASDSPIRTAKNLTGKTIALTTVGDLQQASVETWLDKNGGGAKSVSYIEMPVATMGGALQAKRVDAVFLVEPFVTQLRAETRILATPYDSIAKQLQISGWVANANWLRGNGATAARFVAVMRQTADWANRNRPAAGEILAKVTKIPIEVVAAMNRLSYGLALDAALIQPVIDASAHYGFLPRSFPAAELFARPA
jgi:NitT/TauT family transport system substrate-binding protein